MRKICVVTGGRAEYGLGRPIIKAIKQHPGLRLQLVAAGMHLSEEFGYTLKEIIRDGFDIAARVEMDPAGDTGYDMASEIGNGIVRMAKAFRRLKPDIVVVLTDRIEPFAALVAAAYMNIPVAHVHGGDTSYGGLDESARHAMTKFAHIHFPATRKSAERILRMGEDSRRIFMVGAPYLDTVMHAELLSRKEVEKRFRLDLSKPFILLVQHAVTTETEKAGRQMKETLEAVKRLGYQTIILYPNYDAGGRQIVAEIKKYQRLPFIKVYKNLSHPDYLSLLKHASVFVGNSSSGVIESPAFKVPAVNIGIRQKGRERSTNMIDVGHDRRQIIAGINKALSSAFRKKVKKCRNPYGYGNAGKRIAAVLARIKIDYKLLQKKITY